MMYPPSIIEFIGKQLELENMDERDWIETTNPKKMKEGGDLHTQCFHVRNIPPGKLYAPGTYTNVVLEVWKVKNDQSNDELFAVGQCDVCETIHWASNSRLYFATDLESAKN